MMCGPTLKRVSRYSALVYQPWRRSQQDLESLIFSKSQRAQYRVPGEVLGRCSRNSVGSPLVHPASDLPRPILGTACRTGRASGKHRGPLYLEMRSPLSPTQRQSVFTRAFTLMSMLRGKANSVPFFAVARSPGKDKFARL